MIKLTMRIVLMIIEDHSVRTCWQDSECPHRPIHLLLLSSTLVCVYICRQHTEGTAHIEHTHTQTHIDMRRQSQTNAKMVARRVNQTPTKRNRV